MAKKPNNTDDLTFDSSDEFFPLDNGSTKSDKGAPPKGLKGYLKNVVRSVKNLSVSVTKEMYPEAFNLYNSIKEDQGEGQNINVKETISKYKGYIHTAKDEIKDIAKDIGKGAKDAIRTGYFVKSEEEANDMSDAFGDMFGDDFNFNDFGGDTSDFGDDDDFDNEGQSTGSGRISTGDAVIRSSAASTKALLHASNKQSGVIIGATQSQIRHETKLFAQQILIEQEHHKDKMRVLSNIAKNIAKTVNQNNISIKAQMEYSLKSLAFTQDMNAMLKEIRDAQWALTKPKEEEEVDNRSTRQKVFGQFGDQFGISHWINHIKGQFGGAGMLSSMYDGYKMMTDMGMGKGKAAMQLLGPMIMGQMIESMSSSSQIQSRNLFNRKIAGLPRQLNEIVGHIASGNGKIGGWLSNQAGKGGPMGWIANQIQNLAGKAHIEDDMIYSTDRYNISNRMKEVHPFDNQAHKALTEIIPEFLSRISAGVNHTEQETFDYKSNKMVKKSYFTNLQEQMHQDTIEQTANFYEASERFGVSLGADNLSKNKDYKKVLQAFKKSNKGKDFKGSKYINPDYTPNTDELQKLFPKLLENWMMEGLPLFEATYRQVKYTYNSDGELEPGYYSDVVLKDTGIQDGYEAFIVCNAFYDFLYDWASDNSPDSRAAWVEFAQDTQNYKSRASAANMEFEDRAAMTSSAGLAEDNNYAKQSKVNINNIRSKIKTLKDRLRTANGNNRVSLLKQIDEYNLQLHEAQRNANMLGVNNSTLSRIDKNEASDDDYRLKELEDNSTHGVVKSIYTLLLSGIDVYTRPASARDEKDQAFLNKSKDKASVKYKDEKKAKKGETDAYKYESLWGGQGGANWKTDFLNSNGLTDIHGEYNYKGKIFRLEEDKVSGDLVYTPLKKLPDDITEEDVKKSKLYVIGSEKRAHNKQEERLSKISAKKDDEKNGYHSPFEKIPILGPIIKAFNKVNEGVSNIGNRVLGESFYGEIYDDSMKSNVKGKFGEIKSSISSLKTDIKNDAKKSINAITSGEAKKYLSNKLMGIKIGEKTLGETIAECKDPVLLAKLKENKSNPIEEAKILIDYAKNNEKIQKYITPLSDFVKNNETLMSAASSISGMAKYVKAKVVDKITNKIKSGANKLFGKIMTSKLGKELYMIKVEGKTFKDALTDYYTKNPGIKDANLAKALAFEKSPEGKDIKAIAKFVKETFTKIDDPEIEKYKPEIIRICDDYQSGAKSTIGGAIRAGAKRIFNKITDWFKRKLKEKFKLNDDKKLIPEDMNDIESVDGRKLGDVISQIADEEGITDILKNIPTGPAKAEFLIHQDSPDLKGFKAGLRKYQKEAISGKAKDIGENVKEKFGAAAAFAKNAFNKTANAFKDEEDEENSENKDEDDEYYQAKNGKRKKKRHRRNRDKKKKNRADDDGVEGNSASEMKEAKESKIKQDRQENLSKDIKRMADSMESIQKNGMDFSKDAKESIVDANDNAAFKSEMKNGEGVLGTIRTFMDKTGLGNTKLGSAVKKSADAVGGLLDKAGDVANLFGAKGKIVGTIAKTLAKTGLGSTIASAAGGAISGIVGGAGAAAGAGGGLLGGAIGIAKGLATGGLKGALGVVKTALSKFFEAGPIKKFFKGGVVNTIKGQFAKLIGKFAPKLGAKIATMSAAAATVIALVATAVAGFAKGMIMAKDYFKVGKGMKITIGMRLASGLANSLDMLLFGIPSLISGFLGKANVATWLYEYVGGDAEKMALERYQEYNKKRATVFGISDPLALVAYENRSQGEGIGGKLKTATLHAGRKVLNFITFGLVDGNDTKDAKMLGFKTEKIFQMWRDKKYKPLDEMRETIANEMGVKLSDMEDVTAIDPREVDEDQDNQVDDNEKAQKEMQKLELQTKYRVTYLEACRKYVLGNHIAWLTNRCTPEQFAKYTGGQSAGEEFAKTAGEKVKQHFMKPVRALGQAFNAGVNAVKTAYRATSNFVGDLIADPKATVMNAGNKVTNWLKHIFERYDMREGSKERELMNIAGNEIANVNLGASPNFYGDDPTGEKAAGYQQYAVNHGSVSTPASGDVVNADANGAGYGGGFEGHYMKVKSKNGKPKTKSSPGPDGLSTMDPSDSVTPPPSGKATVKNSRTEDFTENFGKEICVKLSILEEMHKENIRHNEVSEKFFNAALEMLSIIAANSNNKGISEKFASMINSVSRF